MVEIRHKDTGQILLRVEADTLETANLARKELSGADLSRQSLSSAFLTAANLRGANLSGADLTGVDMTNADLTGASLEGANLEGASFFNAIAVNADFSDANLMYTTFRFTTLNGSDLTCAIFGFTNFAFCDDLHETKGLDTINHVAPTSLDTHTLRHSIEHLSNDFLMGCHNTIDDVRDMRIRYGPFHSCFLSYARLDSNFADAFYSDLKDANVPCWQDDVDSRSGPDWQEQVLEAIRTKDKVLIVCSKTSLVRPYVVEEIITSIQMEEESKKTKLIPIDLDGYIFKADINGIAEKKVASGEWRLNWVPILRNHNIAIFHGWQNSTAYKIRFNKLLRDLKRTE